MEIQDLANAGQPNTHPAQSGERVSQGLAGVRRVARDNKEMKFAALLHHLTVDLLRESFYALKRKAAPEWTGSHGRNMRSEWKIDWSIFMAEFIVERIVRSHREECT